MAAATAAPRPITRGTGSVPARRPRSWPPPRCCAATRTPGRISKAPMPGGAVELVAAEAEQIDPQGLHVEGDVAHRLGGVAMEQNPMAPAQRRNLRQRLEHADLVVGGHHRNQQGVGADRCRQLPQIHQTIRLDRQHGEREAMARQPGHRIEHRPVFGRQGDQAPARLASFDRRLRHPRQGQVVRLRGAAGEHHRLGWHAQGGGQLVPRQIHRGGGFQRTAMQAAGGIGAAVVPPGSHRHQHRGIAGRCGVVIEIRQHAPRLTLHP